MSKKMPIEKIPIKEIVIDASLQIRAKLDQATIDEYAERMGEGDQFPPITVFMVDGKPTLAEGFHRLEAEKKLGYSETRAEVRKGTLHDAMLFAVGANARHGLRRTNEDKRRAVMALLADEQWAKKSDRWIAEQCKVSNTFVSGIRQQLGVNVDTSTRTGKDGKAYPGKKPKKPVTCAPNVPITTSDDPEPSSRRGNGASHAKKEGGKSKAIEDYNAKLDSHPIGASYAKLDPKVRDGWECVQSFIEQAADEKWRTVSKRTVRRYIKNLWDLAR